MPELKIVPMNNEVQISVSGALDTQWRLECVDGLGSSNGWQLLTNLTAGPKPIVLQQPPIGTSRFYRGAWVP